MNRMLIAVIAGLIASSGRTQTLENIKASVEVMPGVRDILDDTVNSIPFNLRRPLCQRRSRFQS